MLENHFDEMPPYILRSGIAEKPLQDIVTMSRYSEKLNSFYSIYQHIFSSSGDGIEPLNVMTSTAPSTIRHYHQFQAVDMMIIFLASFAWANVS